MNKMKKIGLTALAASLVSVSAQAVDISGGSSLTYASGNDGVNGNPWSMNDSLTFSWGGELDNGFTVDMSFLLDNSDGAAAQIFDNRTLAIGMGDAGTLTFWGQAGSGVVGSFDDRTPNAYEESWNGGDSPNQGHSASNMFYYTNSVEMATIHASYTPSGGADASNDASSELGIVVNATDNLEVYGAVGTDNGGVSEVDNTIMGAKLTMGAATVGLQVNEADSAAANSDEEFTAWSISYAVSEDMSVAFGQSEINYEAAATASQESTGISASYTMGSMTLAGVLNSIDNQNLTNATGSGNQDTNTDTFEINLSFAF
jgi:outer membrane protein OmpU